MGVDYRTFLPNLYQLREYWTSTQWWRQQAYEAVGDIHESWYENDGEPVTAFDWDTLVVLDGCRADLFEEVVDTDRFDEYTRRRSPGSWTGEWVDRTWTGTYGDLVYTSANPFIGLRAGDAFHELVEAYDTHFDSDLGTVPPDALSRVAREMHEEFPDKRHVVHFMQPHHPFIATSGADEWSSWNVRDPLDASDEMATGVVDSPWDLLATGELPRSAVWDAYRANLELVLEEVEALLEEITGRIVVTSDHGNLVGERLWPIPVRGYGHPRRVRHDALVEVPWAVLEGQRREVVDESTDSVRSASGGVVASRLESLGYTEST